MLPPQTKRWFPYLKPSSSARLRLICLPYAGGGASAFRLWTELLPPDVELCAAQPPGREMRIGEEAFNRSEHYVASLLDAVAPLLDRPYAWFGHSMGALMAFEAAREARARGLPPAVRLFASGKAAPHFPITLRLHDLPEPELIEHLRKLEGTPEEVLAHRELRDLVFRYLRRDFEVLERYRYQPGPPLDMPVRALGGEKDTEATREELEAWSQHTRDFRGVRQFPGGHQYLGPQREPLVRDILAELQRP